MVDKKKYSGFMGDTSPEQDACLDFFRTWIQESGKGNLEAMHFDDYDLLRFCRARNFVIDDIKTMWSNFVDWREENGVDTIIEDYSFDEMEQVQ